MPDFHQNGIVVLISRGTHAQKLQRRVARVRNLMYLPHRYRNCIPGADRLLLISDPHASLTRQDEVDFLGTWMVVGCG